MNLISRSEKGSEVRVLNSDSISGLSSVGVNPESLAWSVAAPLPVRVGGAEVAWSQHVVVGVAGVGT